MKIELSAREWITLYALLEKQSTDDKHVVEVRNRMRSTLVSLLNSAEKSMFDKWFEITSAKVRNLEEQNKQTVEKKILTLDDDDGNESVTYPSVRKQQSFKSKRQAQKKS